MYVLGLHKFRCFVYLTLLSCVSHSIDICTVAIKNIRNMHAVSTSPIADILHFNDMYEYLTGEEMLPTNQKQTIEQAKFTYSPLGKALEEQTKTIKYQGERQQVKAIQNQGQGKTIEKYTYNDEDSPLISEQKEIFHELADERFEETTELDKRVNPDNLVYRYKGSTADLKFDEFDNAPNLLNKIRKSKIKLEYVKNDQIKLTSNLGELKKETKNRSREQKKTKNKKKMHFTILKCFTKQGIALLNFMMSILQ